MDKPKTFIESHPCANCGAPAYKTKNGLCAKCEAEMIHQLPVKVRYDALDYSYNFVQNVVVKVAEKQEELIWRAVQEIGGEAYECISVSKEKVLEAFRDYQLRGEQLPRIKKPYVLEDAIAKYGRSAQVDMAIEEMSELTKALCKERRAQGKLDEYMQARSNIIEEIADVAIMLKQLLIIFGKDDDEIRDKVQKAVDCKIDRLEQMLQNAD